MARKRLTLTSKLLIGLLAAGDTASIFFPSPKEFRRRIYFGQWKNFNSLNSTLHQLYHRGWIKFVNKDNQRFVKLTNKGQLEALLVKGRMPQPEKWDGKWRVFMFDIPEDSHLKRDHLRRLLKDNGYVKLQGSVFVNPYPLNREALEYLKVSGLKDYIRIIKAEEMDDDKDLRKKFNFNLK